MMGKFTGSKLMKVNGHVGTKNKLIFKRMKNDFPKTVSSFLTIFLWIVVCLI